MVAHFFSPSVEDANFYSGLLNGGVFNDRALIADGRNVDNWVLVKQHVNGPTSSLPRYSTIPAQQTPFLTAQSPPSYGEVGRCRLDTISNIVYLYFRANGQYVVAIYVCRSSLYYQSNYGFTALLCGLHNA